MQTPDDWTRHFAGLRTLPPQIAAELVRKSKVVTLPAGSRIYGPGMAPTNFILLLEGSVRVQQVSESGREIVLYRVAPGESCPLTTACLLGTDDYLAEAIAETDVQAVAISRPVFEDVVARSAEFRRFVFEAFSTSIANLCRIIDDVAFSRIDIRLAHKLLELAGGGTAIAATQQQLASELGSAREVVSRVLAEFQRRGWVMAARGSITLADRAALEQLARQH